MDDMAEMHLDQDGFRRESISWSFWLNLVIYNYFQMKNIKN